MTLSEQLRSDTKDLHDATENHGFMRSMAAGKIDREGYIEYLQQMRCVHVALDAMMRRLAGDARLAGPIEEEIFQVGYIDQDLKYLAAANDADPLPGTASLLEMMRGIEAQSNSAVLGIIYVIEGSKNGGRFIARNIRRALDLPEDKGTAYLHPYGERQREVWGRFKEEVDAIDLGEEERTSIVETARSMFNAMMRMADDLQSARVAATG